MTKRPTKRTSRPAPRATAKSAIRRLMMHIYGGVFEDYYSIHLCGNKDDGDTMNLTGGEERRWQNKAERRIREACRLARQEGKAEGQVLAFAASAKALRRAGEVNDRPTEKVLNHIADNLIAASEQITAPSRAKGRGK